jgi:hypothetical protein
MDDETRRYWEQVADRCFDRAYAAVIKTQTLITTSANADCDGKHGHQDTETHQGVKK